MKEHKHNVLGVDVATRAAQHLATKLGKMAATWQIEGPYPYREDKSISQILVTTTWTEGQLDEWLYRVKLPKSCTIYGTFTREEAA